MKWGRVHEVSDLQDAITWLGRLTERHLLIMDLQPGVALWHLSEDQVRDAVVMAAASLAQLPMDHEVLFLSNAPHGPVGFDSSIRVVWAGRKPFTRLNNTYVTRLTGSPDRLPVVVVGDQWLTDGLLALRLQGVFLRLPLPRDDVPLWPRIQSWTGVLVRPLFRDRGRG